MLDPVERTERARELRQDMNLAERKIWRALRSVFPRGLKVRRQVPMGPFFLDFYCFAAKLALELDGSSHEGDGTYDARRDKWLAAEGITVLRVWNSSTDRGNASAVAEWYLAECQIRIAGESSE